MEREELSKAVETLLFITDQPLDIKKLCRVTETADEEAVRAAVAELQKLYLENSRAVQIIEVGGGWQMSTKPEYGRWVRRLFNEKLTMRLSAAALETLAIIAYRQPLTRAEIEVIRGVEVIAPLETLVTRGLVKVAGRKETVGRPLLYGTSEDFLRLFGLNSLDDLPRIDAFLPKKEEGPAELGDASHEALDFESQPEVTGAGGAQQPSAGETQPAAQGQSELFAETPAPQEPAVSREEFEAKACGAEDAAPQDAAAVPPQPVSAEAPSSGGEPRCEGAADARAEGQPFVLEQETLPAGSDEQKTGAGDTAAPEKPSGGE